MWRRGHDGTAIVGRIIPRDPARPEGEIIILNTNLKNLIGQKKGGIMPGDQENIEIQMDQPKTMKTPEQSCCDSPPTAETADEMPDVAGMFMEFMRQANKEGLIDRRSKKLMAIALSVAQRCVPCLKAHITGALAMGISRAEIDEAAYLAISFAGCPALMLYKEVWQDINL